MNNVCKVLLLTCAGTSLALAQGAVEGEKWKITSSMQMAGMSMPGMSQEICKEPGQDSAPIKTDDNCQIYDMQRSGNTQSFKMRCTGKDAVEGSAKFTYLGADRYQGRMEMTTDGETMVMNYEGQKVGQCDGREINLQAKKMIAEGERQQKQAEQAQVKMCRDMAAKGEDPYFLTMCKDPADKQTYCTAVRKPDNFRRLSDMERKNVRYNPAAANNPNGKPLTESARVCGFSVEQEREGLCQLADRNGDLNFIVTECPGQAQALAAAQCAGRRYTAIADRYRNFCSEFASNESRDERQSAQEQEQAQDQPQGAGEKTKGLFNKGKKALGGLFSN